ncbi:hypothetical protein VTN02DRAFT_3054 [Thermoascus thermophilus]
MRSERSLRRRPSSGAARRGSVRRRSRKCHSSQEKHAIVAMTACKGADGWVGSSSRSSTVRPRWSGHVTLRRPNTRQVEDGTMARYGESDLLVSDICCVGCLTRHCNSTKDTMLWIPSHRQHHYGMKICLNWKCFMEVSACGAI